MFFTLILKKLKCLKDSKVYLSKYISINMAATIPYFDRRQTFSTDVLQNSIIQTYMALFISKPELYKDIYALYETDKQSYFFKKFRLFLLKYHHFNIDKDFDIMNYFCDLQIQKKGSVSVCGGGDFSRNAKKNARKNYNKSVENDMKIIEYFQQKYKIIINAELDERTFIGHRYIWKNPSPELLKKDKWEWVTTQSYDDLSFTSPLPDTLDKYLVPLEIRNKAYQKWKNSRNKNILQMKTTGETDMDTAEETESEDETCNQTAKKEEENIPKLIINEDLMKEIDDLF
jgi:hypothetical protein